MQADLVTIPLGGLIALSIGTGVGSLFLFGFMEWGLIRSDAAAEARRLKEAVEANMRLQFEVEAVPANLEPEYRKLYPMRPRLAEFAKAFLENKSYAFWHARVQETVNRHLAEHPEGALFVKVSRMP